MHVILNSVISSSKYRKKSSQIGMYEFYFCSSSSPQKKNYDFWVGITFSELLRNIFSNVKRIRSHWAKSSEIKACVVYDWFCCMICIIFPNKIHAKRHNRVIFNWTIDGNVRFRNYRINFDLNIFYSWRWLWVQAAGMSIIEWIQNNSISN